MMASGWYLQRCGHLYPAGCPNSNDLGTDIAVLRLRPTEGRQAGHRHSMATLQRGAGRHSIPYQLQLRTTGYPFDRYGERTMTTSTGPLLSRDGEFNLRCNVNIDWASGNSGGGLTDLAGNNVYGVVAAGRHGDADGNIAACVDSYTLSWMRAFF